jgi:hypothetical protein
LRQARNVGPSCFEFISKLLANPVVKQLPAALGLLNSLLGKYGAQRLESACSRALDFESIRYGVVKKILEKGLDQAPDLPDRSGQLYFAFLDAPRFARDVGSLLTAEGGSVR